MADRTKKKNPCRHCKDECKSRTSVWCSFCETGFHAKCIDGMTPEFVDSCNKMNKIFGGSAFLCVICRKLVTKINKSIQDVEAKMADLEAELKKANLEQKNAGSKGRKDGSEVRSGKRQGHWNGKRWKQEWSEKGI